MNTLYHKIMREVLNKIPHKEISKITHKIHYIKKYTPLYRANQDIRGDINMRDNTHINTKTELIDNIIKAKRVYKTDIYNPHLCKY